jgi:hypothetical protein
LMILPVNFFFTTKGINLPTPIFVKAQIYTKMTILTELFFDFFLLINIFFLFHNCDRWRSLFDCCELNFYLYSTFHKGRQLVSADQLTSRNK